MLIRIVISDDANLGIEPYVSMNPDPVLALLETLQSGRPLTRSQTIGLLPVIPFVLVVTSHPKLGGKLDLSKFMLLIYFLIAGFVSLFWTYVVLVAMVQPKG